MMNDELPEGWLSCSLGDVVDYGKTTKAEPSEIEEGAWILELEDIEKDTSKLLERRIFAERRSKSTKNRFEVGDVLYGKLRPYLNKVIIADQPGYCTTEIIPLKPNVALNGRYLFSWLKHPVFLDHVSNVSHGLNMPRLGTDAGKAAPFILAPLAEQKRIADKLEAVLGRVDACRARLDRIPDLLKRFRQSALAAATSGQLTEDWRGINSATAIERDDDVLPPEWTEYELKNVAKIVSGFAFSSADFTKDGTPVVKISNVQYGAFLEKNQEYLPRSFLKQYSSFIVQPETLLMALTRPITNDTLKVCVYPKDAPLALLNQRVCKLEPSAKVLRDYLCLVMQTQPFKVQVLDNLSETLQPNLSPRALESFVLILPPIPEQTEIVRRVEALFALADRIEARLESAQRLVERLTPATLSKAFRGDLVPQDPNDEPASKLLERVRGSEAPMRTTKRKKSS